MLNPTSRSAENPGPRLLRFFRLRKKSPAPISSKSDSATCVSTSAFRNRSCPPPTTAPAGRRANVEGSGRRGGRRRAWPIAERAGGYTGGAIAFAADRRGPFFAKPEESEQPRAGIFGGAARRIQH